MKTQFSKNFFFAAIVTLSCTINFNIIFAGNKDVKGKLVVCITSKGHYGLSATTPGSKEGLIGMAELAHKYGFPVTYYLKPEAVNISKQVLSEWHKKYGDDRWNFI